MFPNLILLCLLALVVTSFGKRLFSLFKVKFNSPLECLIFSAGLGFGILSLFILAIGLLGLLYSSVIYVLILFIALFSMFEFKKVILDIVQSYSDYRNIFTNKINLLLFIILILLILLNIIGASGPPSAMDPLNYHLAIPKKYIEKHKIEYIPYIWLSNVPFNMEMLYTLGMIIVNDVFPACIHLLFGLFILIAIFSFCATIKKEKIGLTAVLLFYAMPLVTLVGTSAFVELGLTFYSFLSFYAFYNWKKNNLNKQWLILSGIFSGLAIGTKTTGLFIPTILLLFILFESIKQKRSLMTNIFMFFIFAFIFGGIWYIRNWIWTANPVYPFLYYLFGGKDWNIYSASIDFYEGRGFGKGILNFILVLWHITQNGEIFDMGYALGPMFLSFLPIVILLWKRINYNKILIIFSFFYFIIWFFTTQMARFLFPILPLLSIVMAFVIFELITIDRSIKSITLLTFSLFIIFSLSVSIVFNSQFIPVVFGKISRGEFLSKKVNYYEDFKYINRNLPNDSRILTWCDGQYYLEREWIPAYPSMQGLINYGDYNNSKELLIRLKELNITHILKASKTALEEINSPYDVYKNRCGFKLQRDLEQGGFLKTIYHRKGKIHEHRTLSRGEWTVDIYLYEIDYSKI